MTDQFIPTNHHSNPNRDDDVVWAVTIEEVDSRHLDLMPDMAHIISRFAFVAAVYRDGILADVLAIGARDRDALPALRDYARNAANRYGWAYSPGCDFCGINCPPDARRDHELLLLADSHEVPASRFGGAR